MDDVRSVLLIAALSNAVKHKSVPAAGAVMGAILGTHPELRSKAGEIKGLLGSVLEEVSSLSAEDREEKLKTIAPDQYASLFEKKEKKKIGLPDLPKAEGGVVMRFAPNPSGPLHLGHARAAFLNDEYIRRYGGKYILRIEDTDPKRVDPDAYDMVREDIAWMGLSIAETIFQSDRFSKYYEVGKELIQKGHAYVCRCDNEKFKDLKMHKTACPCRSQSPEEALDLFDQMLDGAFTEGEVGVRLKTDLSHPDPAMRDYPLFRVLTSTPHQRVDAIVYPLMNLSVAVDDHLLGMTHVIRGKDHIANTKRQEFIFRYMGWETPVYRHYGRMGIEGVVLSTSQMRAGIQSGEYSGWDDVRLGTLRAMARRGIQPQAVRNAVVEIGIGETDIQFSWENLYAKNKEIIDSQADRFFFVPDPVLVPVSGSDPVVAKAMRYPGDESRGYREIPFAGSLYLPKAELESGAAYIRLKDLFNIKVLYEGDIIRGEYAGDDLQEARSKKAPIIQWLPENHANPCTLKTPDGDVSGVCEPEAVTTQDRIVQFERVGFARIDAAGNPAVAYFTHR
ncbi:glutamyl-tRNA synthetase [Methanospirillum hungatei JF-1]|uniref:Glutamate--tRNA ligase n=1 Tax=Methanospirillum hungatei JF-1 (strain ATCC 27890 / DSM 864 / NBRC 100397 / JF-1) TaxID=323259 RepID=SYE_METHJ|nr:glutamate--tRNA ligase [Methanospirillum hungatei]Q2FTH6.1 RecName: Full=Glutamate--tRNA ligase; AltName: Full=Glutamyl-tRNA synthetase; Short=GluRS [Methanospirillum hungatei JF-1]ABD42577.1 glutamyl-tRNA synthetase [Methanospirillum hungatei JF-1]